MTFRLWRELRAKETGIFLLALMIGTIAIVTPALLAERLNNGLRSYTAELLGGDIKWSAGAPIEENLRIAAAEYGLSESKRISTTSVIYNPRNDAFQLARVRAIQHNYPLRGWLETSRQPGGAVARVPPPAAGAIWLDSRVAAALAAQIGDSIEVGNTVLRFSAYLQNQPGRPSFFSFAPQVMINLADLEATNLVIPGSRVRYGYFWSGEAESVRQYARLLKTEKSETAELTLAGDEDENFGDILRRLNSFLLLSGSLTIILAAMALVLTSRYYLDENSRYIALLKTLGYTPKQVLAYLAVRLLPPALLAYLAGCLFGWLGYRLIGNILREFLPAPVPGIAWEPFGLGLMSLVICLVAFVLPNLRQLVSVPPYSVLRSRRLADNYEPFGGIRTFGITGSATCIGIFVLILLYSGSWVVAFSLFGGMLGFVILISLMNYGILRFFFTRLTKLGVIWRISVSSLYRNWRINSLQIMAFAAAFMLIGILTVMRVSLVKDWQKVVEPGTPNNFLINIAPPEVPTVEEFMSKRTIATESLFGIVRGKLITVNEESLAERTKRLGTYGSEAEREFNLSWSNRVPSHNKLQKGSWWQPITKKQGIYPVSVESGIAEEFGLDLNDELVFLIGGVRLNAYVANLREVDWEDFKPNFYILFPEVALAEFPRTFITSFYLPPEKAEVLAELTREFPTVALISIENIMRQVTGILNLVSDAMQLILALGVIAALAVFFAALQVSIRLRTVTTVTLRLIGESNTQAIMHNLLEFCFLGLLGGILAAVGTEIVIYCIFTFFLEQEFSFHPYLLVAPLLGALLAGVTGLLQCRQAIVIPPRQLLKKVM